MNTQQQFIPLPSSIQFAILLPTVRWTAMARSVIASLVGVANEEVAVLIADNSENPEKRAFLKQLSVINPYIFSVSHEKNIGAFSNILYLYDWCKDVPFCALMADDDLVSHNYYTYAFLLLRQYPEVTCAEVGNALMDMNGDGQYQAISQVSMRGHTPFERIQQWNGFDARITMYNASTRASLEHALQFYKATPLNGHVLVENLWELSRLSAGDFISQRASGCFIHYPATASSMEVLYNLLYKESGLAFPFICFSDLCTAVLCAMFLMGKLSPIADPLQKERCGQYVFKRIFLDHISQYYSKENIEAIENLFINYPKARAGVLNYYRPPFINNPVFDEGIVNWLIEVIKVFETQRTPLLSEQFSAFVVSVLD